MAVGDRQKLITEIVATVLNNKARTDISFDWFINKHTKEHFGQHFDTINQIFSKLNGNRESSIGKRTVKLECDAYFAEPYNFIFEYDEFQHFTTARLKTLDLYPDDLKVNFSVPQWKKLCIANKEKADRYRKNKVTTDFNFEGGRTAQRAYLDCFRDFLPGLHGLSPTLRINEFEVDDIFSNNSQSCGKIEKILKIKMA